MANPKHKPYPERMQWKTPVEPPNTCGADTKNKPDCALNDPEGLKKHWPGVCTCGAGTTPTPCHLCKGKMVVPADDGHGLQRCVCGNGGEPRIAGEKEPPPTTYTNTCGRCPGAEHGSVCHERVNKQWDKLAVLVNPPGALEQVFALEKERNALLAALAKGSCNTCFYYSPDGKCGQDCDGYDKWKISIDLTKEASELLRRLQLADVSKLAAAIHDYPKVVHELDAAVALLKRCLPYVSHLAPDDLQAALAAVEGK